MKSDSNFQRSGNAAKQALLALSYGGLFFSLSAAFSGLILTNKLRKISAQTPKVSSDKETHGYEGRALTWHCEYPVVLFEPTFPHCIAGVLSLIGGIILPVAQVLLYVWLEESNVVRITLSIITLFAMLPMVFLLFPSDNSKRHNIVSTRFTLLKPTDTRSHGHPHNSGQDD